MLSNLIGDSDIPFEESIARDDADIDTWLRYYAHKSNSTFNQKVFVLERAVLTLPQAEDLWITYTDLLIDHLKDASFYHNRHQFLIVNSVFDRALSLLYQSVPLWTNYLNFLKRQYCDVTRVRTTFNKALFCLASRYHRKIWESYLEFADMVGGKTKNTVYKQYIQGNDVDIMDYVDALDPVTALELLQLVALKEKTSSSPVQIAKKRVELVISIPNASEEKVETMIRTAIRNYPDQIAYFSLKLVEFYRLHDDGNSPLHRLAKIRGVFETSIKKCETTHDFVELYDAYTEYEEEQMLELKTDQELDLRMKFFENLLSMRPFLLNEMHLRKDPHNLDSWLDRIDIYNNRLDKKLQTYAMAFNNVNPMKAHSAKGLTLVDLWAKYANEYASRNDSKTATLIFSKAKTSQFHLVDELADLYIKWSEFTLLSEQITNADDKAVQIVEQVLLSPTSNITKDADSNSVHSQIHQSQKLWAFYLDLLDSFVEDHEQTTEIEKVKSAYAQLINAKLATPLNFINYAEFLQRVSRFEESYKVYEQGLQIFEDSLIRFEIWNVYLAKMIEYKTNAERVRDLFQQCMEECPAHLSGPVVTLYAKFELEKGFLMKSVGILKDGINGMRNTETRDDTRKALLEGKYKLYEYLLLQVRLLKEESLMRDTYEYVLQDKSLTVGQLNEVTIQFVTFEKGHGQFTRCRQLFKFLAKLTSVGNSLLWREWEDFEVECGNETTFRDMLRFKRELGEERTEKEYIGFVKKAEEKKEVEKRDVEKTDEDVPSNPDQIDLDM